MLIAPEKAAIDAEKVAIGAKNVAINAEKAAFGTENVAIESEAEEMYPAKLKNNESCGFFNITIDGDSFHGVSVFVLVCFYACRDWALCKHRCLIECAKPMVKQSMVS